MAVTVHDEADPSAWEGYVEAHPGATQYHRWVWRQVIEESFGHRTYYLSARSDGRVVGLLPLVRLKSRLFGTFLVSLPFVNYGGLLSDGPQVDRRLLEAAEELGRREGAGFVELRHLDPKGEGVPTRTHKVTMLLDLAGSPDVQWATIGSKIRNLVRKAERSGLVASVGGSELVDEFYDVFAVNMRDLGTPVYAKRFFRTIAARLGQACRVVVVRLRGLPVAAGVLLRFRARLEIPWASSLRRYNTLGSNMLLYWTALRWAVEHGIRQFDFGRSTPGSGTYRFKAQWGAKPVQLHWQYALLDGSKLPNLGPDNAKYRLAIALWRRLPVWVTRWLGPPLVRNLP